MNETIEYLIKIARNNPPLTDDEEAVEAKKMLAGDMEARDKLILTNIKFAIGRSAPWVKNNRYRELGDDLAAVAVEGLIDATNTYDGSVRFAAYAWRSIEWAMTRFMAENCRIYRVPRNIARKHDKIKRIIYDICPNNPGAVLPEEVMEVDDKLDRGDIVAVMSMLGNSVKSLDNSVGDDGPQWHEFVRGDSLNPEKKVAGRLVKEALEKHMDVLNERDMSVMVPLFGLDGNEPKLVKEIARELGISPQAASLRRSKAFEKLLEHDAEAAVGGGMTLRELLDEFDGGG